MDNRPIGFFDSGLGGLTAVARLRELLPEENIIYFADTGRNPYGTRTPRQLRHMAAQNLQRMKAWGVKAVVCACGTMSTNAGEVLSSFELPVVNVLDASVEAMSRVPGSGTLAVIATEASIKSGVFCRKIQESSPKRNVIGMATQEFVAMCETGHISPADEILRQSVERCLKEVKAADCDALLLGCTHFGIISEAISAYLGPKVQLLAAADLGAEQMAELLRQKEMLGQGGSLTCYTSGDPTDFNRLAPTILGGLVVSSEYVDPQEMDG